MTLQLTLRNTIDFLFLSFFTQETHELAHTSVGRINCGCWGRRDFNVWRLCKGCWDENQLAVLATYAGPATFTHHVAAARQPGNATAQWIREGVFLNGCVTRQVRADATTRVQGKQ